MIYCFADIDIVITQNIQLSLPWKLFERPRTQLVLSESKVLPEFISDIRAENCNYHEKIYMSCLNCLIGKGVLHLHGSFVLYKNKALIFTGPSGIGKTTQAELWRDYQDALIVNGDACLLRRMDNDQWWAFGTPIHGSSSYCENEKAPIAAIITLEQEEENVLTRMDDFSALSYCLPEFYRPKMDEETEETFWNSVDSLFRSVPVYHLVCRPDREATEIVKKEIFEV